MDQLPLFINMKGRAVILLGDGDAAAAKARLLERAGAVPVGEDDDAARIAFVALEDDVDAVAAVARLKARGLLVNAVDRPELCDFTTPAIIDRSPVLVAIGTGGASAGLAKALRQRLEILLPAGLGRLAEALFAVRDAIKSKWPDAADRRREIDAGLAEGGPLDPLREIAPGAMDGWLAGSGQGATAGLYEIHLTSSDPDDLTLKQVRLLGSADRIYHDADVPPAILARARADAVCAVMDGQAATLHPRGIAVVITLADAVVRNE